MLITIVRASVALTLSLLALSAVPAVSASECTKLIFNRYCLGGPASMLPANATRYEPDESQSLVRFQIIDGERTIDIEVRNNRAVRISRKQPPGSWLNFTDYKTKLVRRYGRGQDLGQFPAYATSRSSRLNAINAGKGFAHTRWQQNGWSVSLLWRHRDHIVLQYELDESAGAVSDDEGL